MVSIPALASALTVLGLAFLLQFATIPTDDLNVNLDDRLLENGRMVVQPARLAGREPSEPTLVRGQILTVDGQPPPEWLLLRSGPAAEAAGGSSYVVRTSAGDIVTVVPVIHPFPVGWALRQNWPVVAWVLVFFLVSVYLMVRRPLAAVARVMLTAAALQILAARAWIFGFRVSDLTRPSLVLSWFVSVLAAEFVWCCGVHLVQQLSPAHSWSRRHRWLVPAVYASVPVMRLVNVVPAAFRGSRAAVVEAGYAPGVAEKILLPTVFLAFLISARRPGPLEQARSRIDAVVLSLAAATAGYATLVTIPNVLLGWPLLRGPWQGLLCFPLVLALITAVLRHQLLDLTDVLNRTATWVLMTAMVLGCYLVLIAGSGWLLTAWVQPVAPVLASGVLAVAFLPVRHRLQGWVNAWTYGERDPDRLEAQLSRQIHQAPTPHESLNNAVQLINDRLRLAAAEIRIRGGPRVAWTAGADSEPGPWQNIGLTHHGKALGDLAVRWPVGRAGTHLDLQLLHRLAPQLATALHLAQLTAADRFQRERLVHAREEERRRIYRDLHDGSAATLAATALHLQLIQAQLPTGLETIKASLAALTSETQAVAEGVRRMMDGLSPPVLHELGLLRALQEKATTYSVTPGGSCGVHIEVEDVTLPELPVGTQVAAYRIAVEAMLNVIRHAAARTCVVTLSCTEWLTIAVRDDGVGLPGRWVPGAGLRSIHERAEELGGSVSLGPRPGGGTELSVRLPRPGSSE
jgi:signal transduction histidine kinase